MSVEATIRRAFPTPRTLTTYGRGAEFVVDQHARAGLVLLLGEGRHRVVIPWACLEGLPDFLRHRGWVAAGGQFTTEGEADTLDGYLKPWVKVQTSRWLARVLEVAGLVNVDTGRPLRVRLRATPAAGTSRPAAVPTVPPSAPTVPTMSPSATPPRDAPSVEAQVPRPAPVGARPFATEAPPTEPHDSSPLHDGRPGTRALDDHHAAGDDRLLERRFRELVERFDAAQVEGVPITHLLGLLLLTRSWGRELEGARERLIDRVRARLERDDPLRCDDLLRGLTP